MNLEGAGKQNVLDLLTRATSHARCGDVEGTAEEIGCPYSSVGDCPITVLKFVVSFLTLGIKGENGPDIEQIRDMFYALYLDRGITTSYQRQCSFGPKEPCAETLEAIAMGSR